MDQGKLEEGNREQGTVKKGMGTNGKGRAKIKENSRGLTDIELEKLKAQACAMSLDELVDYALKALAELELPTPQKSTTAAQKPTRTASN